MPTAVTHLLIPLLLVALYRDLYLKKKDKRKFPLHYVLLAGLGGVLPDIDFIFFLILQFYGYSYQEVHRQITHALIFPVLIFVLGLISYKAKPWILRKHHITLKGSLFAISFGALTHAILDAVLMGDIHPFIPFSNYEFGLNLLSYLPGDWPGIAIPLVEGILLIIWLVYLEWKHKISDFI